MAYLLWALGGWCGTPWRHWPPPPPPGDPWLVSRIAGVLGGLGGGYLAASTFASDPMPGLVCAIIGGRVVSDLVGRFSGPKGG